MEPQNPNLVAESLYSWIEVDEKRCNKCGLCIDMCPMNVLDKGSRGFPFMLHRDDCWYCDACVFLCPRQAIKLTDLPYLIR
jgi:NAD-dependent dihydropyrimidine dehydrogenase PreA subunit|uniref:4Fe-4S dicluster domain-containing protein n=1 Tax=uncultured Bilophila sp. TaxID=529385 RepID=UPI0025EE31F7|nr:ferredoxin family protein [uncultured Bilophila sp.]